ncbi:MAG: SDR family NAD(P)-dependent oxidoreductase [Pirellula sp.]|nr:SDR family NAD(P)-dependent oxidoreductase [Pirellula sp.]
MKIEGKVAIVSGASSGLGQACAQRLIARGCRVVGLDIAAPRWTPTTGSHDSFTSVVANVVDGESVQAAHDRAIDRFGHIDIAICCAGVLHGERLVGREGPAKLDAFRRVLEINVIGTFNVIRFSAAAMMRNELTEESSERGVIVMTSSIAAFDGQIGQSAYSASKGAVASMTLPIARELGAYGIRVVSIAPGVFETPMMQGASEKVRQPLLEQTVFPKRFGLPHEYAELMEQVIANPMLNGTTIRLDGALHM